MWAVVCLGACVRVEDNERNWTVIIAITAGVGGLLVLAVIIAVIILIVSLCLKAKRQAHFAFQLTGNSQKIKLFTSLLTCYNV